MKKSRITSAILLIALCFSLGACTPNTTITGSRGGINLFEGETYNLVHIGDGVSFSSRNENIADIDENGVILANDVGNTVITAKSAKDVRQYTVSVAAAENTQNGAFGQFEDINDATSYIGCGYNVIDSPYINANSVNMENPIFNKEKLKKAKLSKSTTDIFTKVTEASGDTMASLMSDMTDKLNVSASAGYKEYFSASVNTEFSSMAKKNEVSKEHFMKMYSSTQSMSLSLAGSRSKQIDYVDDDFYEDLKKLDINDLFEIYGTHVIISATYGGRLDFSYYMSSNEKTTSQQDLMNIGVKISGKVAGFSASGSTDISQSYATEAASKNIKVQMSSSTLGGDTYAMRNEKDLADNYGKWLNSVKDKPAIIGIPNSRSLKPIWEFLPDNGEYKMRRQAIKAKFEELGSASYNQLLGNYGIAPPKPTISDGVLEFGEYPQSRATRIAEEACRELAENNPQETIFTYEEKKYFKFIPTKSSAGYDVGKMYFFLIEPITWRYIQTTGKGSQIITTKVLDAGPYLTKEHCDARRNGNTGITLGDWEHSDAREYLNGYFYNNAFSKIDKSRIQQEQVINDPLRKRENPYTHDSVYIFANKYEVKKFQTVFNSIKEVTDFAYAKGIRTEMSYFNGKTQQMWMRYGDWEKYDDRGVFDEEQFAAVLTLDKNTGYSYEVTPSDGLWDLLGFCPVITINL